MRFRTEVEIPVSEVRIGYGSPVMFIGSCFAGEIARRMAAGFMQVMVNPSGVVYNPYSVATTLEDIISDRVYDAEDLWEHNGRWLSFNHYTNFSSESQEAVINAVNRSLSDARLYLSTVSVLFVTFGTSRIFRRADSGEIVSNCHKVPSTFFQRELLKVSDIVDRWSVLLDRVAKYNPSLKVIFTISPVRHWKDGPHGNQVSKSVLFLAVEELLRHPIVKGYFPSYEIVMDDLRDYRFYAGDMLHPSEQAVDYIWKRFQDTFMDADEVRVWDEIAAFTKATRHRFVNPTSKELTSFSRTMLKRIEGVEKRYPHINLSPLRYYFNNLIEERKG